MRCTLRGLAVPLLAAVALSTTASVAQAQWIYWTVKYTATIQRAHLDGSGLQSFDTGCDGDIRRFALDAGTMYWTIEGGVERANLGGSNVETVLEGLGYANDIALDLRPNVVTSFTYQGQLKHHGRPVDALCDFLFCLWDDPDEGSVIGSTLSFSGVSVAGGLFAVELDFGGAVFDGTKRWLEVAVRCPDGPHDFTVLEPRQPITPAPYAQFSLASPAFHPVDQATSSCLAIDADVQRLREEVKELTAGLRRVEDLLAEHDAERRNVTPR